MLNLDSCVSNKSWRGWFQKGKATRQGLALAGAILGATPPLAAAGAPTPVVLPSGVSNIHFPLSQSTLSSIPGLTVRPTSSVLRRTNAIEPKAIKFSSAISGSAYFGCQLSADAPSQEIIDLAASLKNNWQLIYAYVYNNIDVEITAESQKGVLGTYLDQSGNSFDQSSLLIGLLRAAGYTANFMVGSRTFTASQLGLASLPQQLIQDAGGSANGSTPYAWVQASGKDINGTITLDPAGKSYNTVPATWLESYLSPNPPSSYNLGTITGLLNAIGTANNGAFASSYNSLQSLVGGRYIVYNANPPQSTSGTSGSGPYTSLDSVPTASYNRIGLILTSANSSQSPIYLCTDQIYGHQITFNPANGGTLNIDGVTAQSGFTDPVNVEIWHPNPAGAAWQQSSSEIMMSYSSIINLAMGNVGQFRAQRDANDLEALASAGPTAGSNAAFVAASSSAIAQTQASNRLFDQIVGTYTVDHHTVQIVRSNNTIDTPLTSTSTDQPTNEPGSGLWLLPQSVPYALSAIQSAQEAVALTQAGSTQTISAVQLLVDKI